ncbi:uncharacterized protein LOC131670926 [Phymastichus coffea]|uniref:uncharacterized protein LOC131670926 n=1 Tax=Phymastichus coffea TaxID=108790 RepID=UPI00273B84E4|nr:uncharacterized protein LOC131670926 [Phymastichus coffea]
MRLRFQSEGKEPEVMDLLKSEVTYGAITGATSLSILDKIPSSPWPGDTLLMSAFSTSLTEKVHRENMGRLKLCFPLVGGGGSGGVDGGDGSSSGRDGDVIGTDGIGDSGGGSSGGGGVSGSRLCP